MIRQYEEKDLDFVKENDMLASFEMQYHKDVIPNEMFTEVDESGDIKGVLYFKYHYTWNGPREPYHYIVPCYVTEEDETEYELLQYAKEWFEKQDKLFEGKRAALAIWKDDTEKDAIQKYMRAGFIEYEVNPCCKFDLKNEIPDFPVPQGMHIEEMQFSPETVTKYIKATAAANENTPDSANEAWFMTGAPDFKVFLLMDGDKIVSGASIWKITDERGAIENIFTVPEYRKKNAARTIITYALKQLKDKEYDIATLGMRGVNQKASLLYQSLSFELFYNQILLIYPKKINELPLVD